MSSERKHQSTNKTPSPGRAPAKMTNQPTINEVVSELTAETVNRTRKMVLNEVIAVIEERRSKLEIVLENGREYWSHATGERFARLHESRQKVWNKVFMYNDMIGLILNMR